MVLRVTLTGHLPKRDIESARAWMQIKLLIALLTEHFAWEARFFPHGDIDSAQISRWMVWQELAESLITALRLPLLSLPILLTRGQSLRPKFRIHRPNRPLQIDRFSSDLS